MVQEDRITDRRARILERLEQRRLVRVKARDPDGHHTHELLVGEGEGVIDDVLDGELAIIDDEDDIVETNRVHLRTFDLESTSSGEREPLFGSVVEVIPDQVHDRLISERLFAATITNCGDDRVCGQIGDRPFVDIDCGHEASF